jgi:hypothetical protein
MENNNIGRTNLRVAAIQKDCNPAPTAERLARAQRLVADAVEAGAELVVLPECFNTGYTFSEENHERVETADGHATYYFPNGDHFTLDDLGSRAASMSDSVTLAFGEMINQQTAWLGVPAVHAIECGHIRTDLPMARRALMTFVFTAPWLLKHLPQANGMQMSCDSVHECKIVDSSGEILARLSEEDGEAFTTAEVQISSSRRAPRSPQPAALVPDMSYFLVDRYRRYHEIDGRCAF